MYTNEDAAFDCEERSHMDGTCGKCGRQPSECGHCEECGAGMGKHHLFCSNVVQHCVKDEDTGREFCLYVVEAPEATFKLVELREFNKGENRWDTVSPFDGDGGQWWATWSSEVAAGEFPCPKEV